MRKRSRLSSRRIYWWLFFGAGIRNFIKGSCAACQTNYQSIWATEQIKDLPDKKKAESATVISADIMGYIKISDEIKIGF